MNRWFVAILLFFSHLAADLGIISSHKRIILEDYKDAHNPSIIKIDDKIILTFRYCPVNLIAPWISYIGIVLLDDNFDVLSAPIILNTRKDNLLGIPSQSEDARIFQYNGKIYLLYNDNIEKENPKLSEKRDLFIAELLINDCQITLGKPLKLFHKFYAETVSWQKNWTPFVWNQKLLMGYSASPYEIIEPNLETGECKTFYKNNKMIANWHYGIIRGGTPAIPFDGQYLTFFHSSYPHISKFSMGKKIHHYYMGAMLFSLSPPFAIKKISEKPIVGKYFYTISNQPKRVIFPGGFFVEKDNIFMAYGKDDKQIWICSINKQRLKEQLVDVKLK